MHSKNKEGKKSSGFLLPLGHIVEHMVRVGPGSTSELGGASVAAALVTHPASFFLSAFEVPEPSAAFFFFADVLPFFGRGAFGNFEVPELSAALFFITAGAGATPPAAEIIRGVMKRGRARPMLGGAPAEARPTLPALGFAAAAAALEGSWL